MQIYILQWPELNTSPVRCGPSDSVTCVGKSIYTQLQATLETVDVFDVIRLIQTYENEHYLSIIIIATII